MRSAAFRRHRELWATGEPETFRGLEGGLDSWPRTSRRTPNAPGATCDRAKLVHVERVQEVEVARCGCGLPGRHGYVAFAFGFIEAFGVF